MESSSPKVLGQRDEPKLLFYDIETTDLDADFGHCLAFGYKWAGGPTRVLSLLDFDRPCKKCSRADATDDRKLIQAASNILNEADVVYTWFGKGFDEKFLNTRVLDARLPPLRPNTHIDLYFTAKHHLKLSSNRLASVQDFLRLPTAKTPVAKRVWRKAQAGHVPSLRYVIDHCYKDVDVLEEAYQLLKPYVRSHPRVFSQGCKMCGSTKLVTHMMRVTTTKGPREQIQCKDCGSYETRQVLKNAKR